ncbi:MAG: ArsR family transcriptional regulator [Candidatus Korarchaeota archaeon NZ13-K]|nr:MAG: ArsR family transcriptional regulator [Candidatus Korarchaeota archaeon NZ13-K]
MNSELRERVLRELSKDEVLHVREILNRLNVPISALRQVLNEMVEEGLLERFSHGGYTFYRITAEGRSHLAGGASQGASSEAPDDEPSS